MRKTQADLSHLCILTTQEDKAASISGFNLSLSLSLSLFVELVLYPLASRLSQI